MPTPLQHRQSIYLITIGISIFLGDGNFYPCVPSLIKQFGNEITAVIVQTILSALLGAGFAGSSLIWEKDDWSLLKQTSVYFAIVTVLMMTVAYVCKWMEHSVKRFFSSRSIFNVGSLLPCDFSLSIRRADS